MRWAITPDLDVIEYRVGQDLTGEQVPARLVGHTEKGAVMGTMSNITSQIEEHERAADRLRAKLAQVSQYTFLDELPEGSVVWFKIEFNDNRNVAYTYVMVKVNGLWHRTGRDGAGHNSAFIADWWSQYSVFDIWVASEWATVEEMVGE